MQTERFDTVVIGAGQAGLVTGYHLQRAGRSFVILDGGARSVTCWRRRYDSLRLFTPAWACALGRDAVPVQGLDEPHEGRVRGLPRGVRDAVRACRCARGCGSTACAATVIATSCPRGIARSRRRTSSWRQERTGTRGCHVRGRPRSVDRPAALQRVPEPVTAAGRSCAHRRRRELGSRHRVGGREDPPDHDVGEPDRAHPPGHRRLDRAQRRVPPDPVPGACTCSRAATRSGARRSRRCPRRATCSCA